MQLQLNQMYKETGNITSLCTDIYNNQTDDLDSIAGGYTESHAERYYITKNKF